jgi:hypothetical protein
MSVEKPALQIALLVATWGLSLSSLVAAPCETETPRVGEPMALSAEAAEFLRATTLLLVPHSVVDEDDWGQTRRIQSGLNVRLDGVQLRTSRRWKNVKHGEWKRVEVTMLDPAERFELQVEIIPQDDPAASLYRVRAKVRVGIKGRQQRWANGVKLYSISGEAIADVAVSADVELQRKVVGPDGNGRLRVLPSVKSASMRLNGFRLQRVGDAKGAVVREFGRSLSTVASRLVSRKSRTLAAKLNSKIEKKPERFEIPLGIFAVLFVPQEGE